MRYLVAVLVGVALGAGALLGLNEASRLEPAEPDKLVLCEGAAGDCWQLGEQVSRPRRGDVCTNTGVRSYWQDNLSAYAGPGIIEYACVGGD
jgi:hypothetical protein